MARWPAFVGGSYPATAASADVEDTLNLYVETVQTRGAKNPEGMLLPAPGFTSWATSTVVGSRAAVYAEGRLFWLMGTALQEISSAGVVTNRGTVVADGNPGQLAYNGIVGGHLAQRRPCVGDALAKRLDLVLVGMLESGALTGGGGGPVLCVILHPFPQPP